MISGRARRLWGNIREEGSGWPGKMSIATQLYTNCAKKLYTNFALASVNFYSCIVDRLCWE